MHLVETIRIMISTVQMRDLKQREVNNLPQPANKQQSRFSSTNKSHIERSIFLTTKLSCLAERRSLYTIATKIYQIYKNALVIPLLTNFWYFPTDPAVHVLYFLHIQLIVC